MMYLYGYEAHGSVTSLWGVSKVKITLGILLCPAGIEFSEATALHEL